MMTIAQSQEPCAFLQVIAEMSGFNWADLTQERLIHSPNLLVFSIQYRANMQIACALFPRCQSSPPRAGGVQYG